MKLSPEEIQFIDNYLKKSDVVFVDIRSEMVDHIASAVETKMEKESLSFYEAFKQYMAANKKALMKNKGDLSIFSKGLLLSFLKFIVHPLRLVLAALLFAFFTFVDVNAYFSEDFTIQNLFFVILLVTAIGQMIYICLIVKQRFFVLERLGSLLGLLYYLQMFFMNNHSDKEPGVYALTFFFYILIIYLLYFAREMYKFQEYKKYFPK